MSSLLDQYEEAIRAMALPLAEITFSGGDVPLTASKVGGDVYWPLPMSEYPRDCKHLPMVLLAQINWEEVPHLEDYPTEGLLQFFISAVDDLYGLRDEDRFTQIDFRIVYHQEVINSEFISAEWIGHQLPEFWDTITPHDWRSPLRMNFSLALQPMTTNTWQFMEIFSEIFDDLDLRDAYNDKYINSTKSQIGGWPFFTQNDVRYDTKEYDKGNLLLQINSEYSSRRGVYDILWSDRGVGNFFISKADLRALNFSRVLYHWDSY